MVDDPFATVTRPLIVEPRPMIDMEWRVHANGRTIFPTIFIATQLDYLYQFPPDSFDQIEMVLRHGDFRSVFQIKHRIVYHWTFHVEREWRTVAFLLDGIQWLFEYRTRMEDR
jgi:hypothetical protein